MNIFLNNQADIFPKPLLRIVKIGGNIIDQKDYLSEFLENFAAIPIPKILVHGGGKKASELLQKLGIEPKMSAGRRITDSESLEIVQMVYAGLINKNIVATLQGLDCNAFGLSGTDGNSIQSVKRPAGKIDYGFAGDIKKVNSEFIEQMLNCRLTPVFCALTHDARGQMLNTNADTIAATLGSALSESFKTEIFYCFERPGLLEDVHNDSSVINDITVRQYQKLKKNKQINLGMVPKLDNAFDALKKGVSNVQIIHAAALSDCIQGQKCGTTIRLSENG